MRKTTAAIAAAVAVALPVVGAEARPDVQAPPPATSGYELVVFEVDGCTYCPLFRRDVAPLYLASALGKEAPIRYVNVSRADETKMGITSAITIAPTVVLMREGQEVDRIVGYTGPHNFMQLVRFMMGRPD